MAGDLASAKLAALADELAETERAWRAVAGALSPAQFNWRPAPGRWSVGEHLAHLNLVGWRLVPLSFGQWPVLTAAHDRRHLWMAERVIEAPGFLDGGSSAPSR